MSLRSTLSIAASAVSMALLTFSADVGAMEVSQFQKICAPTNAATGLYIANRAPLIPSRFIKLPIGSIQPKGWLRHMLELERDGLTGRLKEVSPWLDFQRSSWADKEGKGGFGWEELPYWLKGYGDLGYVLKDETIIAEARKWIEAAMASQREDGWFGPRGLLTSIEGKVDLWPNMVMLNALQSYYEFSGDKRVLDTMTRYFKWEDQLPPETFGVGYWPKVRAGDNIESIYWLYNRTGEAWLPGLAKKIHENMARWDQDVINWHNVNIAQGFRAPAVYWMQAKTPALLDAAERNYEKVMNMYGQFPGGGFAGDENCRPGYTDPRQGFETCGIVEFMHSFEMLTRISGNPIWADRCEELAFNTLPAAMPPDQKGLHYLTCPNQVQLDRNNKAPGVEDGGTMFSYSPFEVYRCCQHNVSHGWPYYAEELWLATGDNGLCASLYAESEVTAKVATGSEIKIAEKTDYPFGDTIEFTFSMEKPVQFPLYLRIPGWCTKPKLDGKPADVKAPGFLVVSRKWRKGDVLRLQLPMQISVRTWEKNNNAVSVGYGPLTFSLFIEEKWQKYGSNSAWPEWEVYPGSAWNYGLELDGQNPAKSFQVVHTSAGRLPAQPFTATAPTIVLKAKGRKIPAWHVDRLNLVGKLQPSPAQSDEPLEPVTLIPMGAARLRIACFPTVSSGPDAHVWTSPPKAKASAYKATASHCFVNDSIDAIGDELEPANSNDPSIPRFTWWDHRGTREWVQYDFEKPKTVSQVSVYWFDDTGVGHCRVPQSWELFYKSGDDWKPVKADAGFGTNRNGWNTVKFQPVETMALRIQAQLQPEFSGGILEWKLE